MSSVGPESPKSRIPIRGKATENGTEKPRPATPCPARTTVQTKERQPRPAKVQQLPSIAEQVTPQVLPSTPRAAVLMKNPRIEQLKLLEFLTSPPPPSRAKGFGPHDRSIALIRQKMLKAQHEAQNVSRSLEASSNHSTSAANSEKSDHLVLGKALLQNPTLEVTLEEATNESCKHNPIPWTYTTAAGPSNSSKPEAACDESQNRSFFSSWRRKNQMEENELDSQDDTEDTSSSASNSSDHSSSAILYEISIPVKSVSGRFPHSYSSFLKHGDSSVVSQPKSSSLLKPPVLKPTILKPSTKANPVGTTNVHMCKICQKTFKTKGGLSSHNTQVHVQKKAEQLKENNPHTQQVPKRTVVFSCPFCALSYAEKAAADRHALLFHKLNVKVVYCNQCGEGFVHEVLLKEHLKVHLDPVVPIVVAKPSTSKDPEPINAESPETSVEEPVLEVNGAIENPLDVSSISMPEEEPSIILIEIEDSSSSSDEDEQVDVAIIPVLPETRPAPPAITPADERNTGNSSGVYSTPQGEWPEEPESPKTPPSPATRKFSNFASGERDGTTWKSGTVRYPIIEDYAKAPKDTEYTYIASPAPEGPKKFKHPRRKCSFCIKTVSVPYYNTHKKTHSGALSEPVTCPEPDCSKQYSSKRILKEHIEKVHELKVNHTCYVCLNGFYRRRDQQKHISIAHDKIRFVCVDCVKDYKYKDGLQAHNRNIHSPAPVVEVITNSPFPNPTKKSAAVSSKAVAGTSSTNAPKPKANASRQTRLPRFVVNPRKSFTPTRGIAGRKAVTLSRPIQPAASKSGLRSKPTEQSAGLKNIFVPLAPTQKQTSQTQPLQAPKSTSASQCNKSPLSSTGIASIFVSQIPTPNTKIPALQSRFLHRQPPASTFASVFSTQPGRPPGLNRTYIPLAPLTPVKPASKEGSASKIPGRPRRDAAANSTVLEKTLNKSYVGNRVCCSECGKEYAASYINKHKAKAHPHGQEKQIPQRSMTNLPVSTKYASARLARAPQTSMANQTLSTNTSTRLARARLGNPAI